MSRLDWLAMGFLLVLAGALVVAVFLYLRKAYRDGGWKQVKVSLFVAIAALVALHFVRIVENSDLEILKQAVNRVTR